MKGLIVLAAKNHILSKLDTIHNAVARIIAGAFRISPIIAIFSESQLIPLDVRRQKLTMNYTFRLLSTPKNQAYKLLSRNINYSSDQAKFPIYRSSSDLFKEIKPELSQIKYNIVPNFHCWPNNQDIKTLIISEHLQINAIIELYPNYKHIFTLITKV